MIIHNLSHLKKIESEKNMNTLFTLKAPTCSSQPLQQPGSSQSFAFSVVVCGLPAQTHSWWNPAERSLLWLIVTATVAETNEAAKATVGFGIAFPLKNKFHDSTPWEVNILHRMGVFSGHV